jgi:peptide/nickel transport system ATP-binding protein
MTITEEKITSFEENKEVILEVNNLKTYYPIFGGFFKRKIGEVKAVDGVSFNLYKQETLGLVGESGCGKTTIGNTILNLVRATSGEIIYKGRRIENKNFTKDLRRKIQMVFQDPDSSLNPRWKVINLIGEPLKILMGIRIVIARALACNPELIILDEPTSALDVSVQAQILNLLKNLQTEFGFSYLFITHDLSVIQHIGNRIQVMYLGKMVEGGTIDEVFYNPTHPYTKALLSARPTFDPTSKSKRVILEGDVPSAINPPSGCAFHPRCYEKGNHVGCDVNKPTRVELGGEHYMYCAPLSEEKKSYKGMEYISD